MILAQLAQKRKGDTQEEKYVQRQNKRLPPSVDKKVMRSRVCCFWTTNTNSDQLIFSFLGILN